MTDGFERMLSWLEVGDPAGEVGAAYLAKELLREVFATRDAFIARPRLVAFYTHCAEAEVPELARLARTIERWEAPILRWHLTGLTNGRTEGRNLIIKNIPVLECRSPAGSDGFLMVGDRAGV